MITLHQISAFQKMWSWLSAHPAHDQDYYMTHVVRLQSPWINSCPLCDNDQELCNNCSDIWQSPAGNLCSDSNSPLRLWQQTSIDDPDNRTYFAGRLALLAMRKTKTIRDY